MKELKITVPEGFEIDKENSTFECIKFKPFTTKCWEDISEIRGYFISIESEISNCGDIVKSDEDKNVFKLEKHAKSALAMAQISQLLPYYGGEITDAQWLNDSIDKYILTRSEGKISARTIYCNYEFLAFNTPNQRDSFLRNNEQLVKNYLMID